MKSSFLILFICFFIQVEANELFLKNFSYKGSETDQFHFLNHKKKKILLISEASAYAVSLIALNQLWYAEYPRSKFHFINDNKEWLQMDKMGHMSASYYSGVAGIKAYKWAGFSRKKAIWYGGMTGSVFLTIIEILDGTSKQWGASSGDLIANTTGSLLAIGQALRWNTQKIQLKYSYHPTDWAKINPGQLGGSHVERALKDYNGQTYWITFNIKSLLNIESNIMPNWLGFSLGYSGDAMTQPFPKEDNVKRYRQYYMSLDVDLNKIKTKNKIANSILYTFGFLKFPMPTLELNNSNVLFHPIYY